VRPGTEGDIGSSFGEAQPRAAESTVGGMIRIPPAGRSLADIESEVIQLTLTLAGGNLSATARILGISRPTLARKLRQAGLTRRSVLSAS
jgi:DNA-binding NtrC family response regulator